MASQPRSLVRPGSGVSDIVFRGLLIGASVIVILVALVMTGTLLVQAMPTIGQFGLSFLTTAAWSPNLGKYGAAIFIFGTLSTSLLALLFAVPISIAVAIFLSEMAPLRLRSPLALLVELLAAIPSVVYGLWAIFVLTPAVSTLETWLSLHFGYLPFFQGAPIGLGILDAGLVLTIMILPTITAVSREVLRAVPRSQREASFAMGATQWETIWNVVLVYARSGIIGGVILGLGRAVGETMAVTMVIGNGRSISWSVFQTTDTLASVIANQFSEASDPTQLSALLELGLLLFIISVLLNAFARLLVWRVAGSTPAGR